MNDFFKQFYQFWKVIFIFLAVIYIFGGICIVIKIYTQ